VACTIVPARRVVPRELISSLEGRDFTLTGIVSESAAMLSMYVYIWYNVFEEGE